MIDTSGLEPFADLLKEIYGDLAKPGVAQVGIALATVIGLLNTCLSPIKFLNEKTELNRQNNLKQLAKRFSEIPPEKIVEAPPEIAIPITEKLVYITNEELRSLYIELLAKASTMDLNKCAHPSFINIINSLSPDEAILLKILNKPSSIRTSSTRNRIKNKTAAFHRHIEADETFQNILFKENLAAYLHNLEGLGLISIIDDNSAQVENIKSLGRYLRDTVNNPKGFKFLPHSSYTDYHMILFVTHYGRLFLKSILSEDEYREDEFDF